jgi:hypothetical protein
MTRPDHLAGPLIQEAGLRKTSISRGQAFIDFVLRGGLSVNSWHTQG